MPGVRGDRKGKVKKGLLILCAAAFGCHHEGYQKDRTFRAVHIFGIGWFRDKDPTNPVNVFAIGNLDATMFTGTTQTNAPYVIRMATNAPTKTETNELTTTIKVVTP
jgi:hypothetical protein